MDKVKRYVVFLIGLFVNSLGVSLITKASLGTSPISSIPYVLSLKFPFTLGEFTIFFSLFLIFLQLLILRRNFKAEHFLQIPISILFGYFIDLSMILFAFVNPQTYPAKIANLLIGCLILGFGVYLEVLADVAMLPGESFVRAVTATWKTEFGTTKIVFDVSMTGIAAVLSFLFFGRLNGVREGTVVAALLVGFIARLLGRVLHFLDPLLFGNQTQETSALKNMKRTPCIVIGRQYGSGGHDFGKQLAEKLGYDFYDNEIIQLTAKTTGYSADFIKKREESMTNSLLYDLMNQMYQQNPGYESPKDTIFEAEEKVVKELAEKGNCVIVGRCADYTLRECENCLRIFLHAPLLYRIRRVMEQEHLTEREAKGKIHLEDKKRSDNYRYYTHQILGYAPNYQLSLDTEVGYEKMQQIVLSMLNGII